MNISKIQQPDAQLVSSLMPIWLTENLGAHDFIDADYWQSNYELVKSLLPNATLYIVEEQHKIIGFAGMQADFLAGIFINHDFQNQGIGTQLLNTIKSDYELITLAVYQKNKKALQFYRKHAFKVISQQIDVDTAESEYHLRWQNKNLN